VSLTIAVDPGLGTDNPAVVLPPNLLDRLIEGHAAALREHAREHGAVISQRRRYCARRRGDTQHQYGKQWCD